VCLSDFIAMALEIGATAGCRAEINRNILGMRDGSDSKSVLSDP
jgi:hypothetical protein